MASTSSARLAGRGELERDSSLSLKENCRWRKGAAVVKRKGSSMSLATSFIIANACTHWNALILCYTTNRYKLHALVKSYWGHRPTNVMFTTVARVSIEALHWWDLPGSKLGRADECTTRADVCTP